jgi:signal transduction histidine kinase/ABC-type nitrate/sulfonate/bicarbonate transport system substrate-binding protein
MIFLMKIIILCLISLTQVVISKSLEKVSLQLHWKYQFESAGFIAAKEKGFYKDVGLDVDIKEFDFGLDIEGDILSGKSTYGIYSSSIILSYLQGKKIKLIASFFKRSAMVLVVKPNIKSPKDLIGKKIMTDTKKDFDLRFKYMFDSQGVNTDDLMLVKHTYNVEDFAKGKVDAIASFISDEPYKLDVLGVKYNILNPSDYGVYNLLLELFTSEEETLKHSERTDAFKRASIKGWEYALNHKEEIIDIIQKKYAKKLTKEVLRNEADEIEKLILPYAYDIGSIDRSFLDKQLKLFKMDYNINTKKTIDDFIFNNQLQTILTETEEEYLKNKKIINICGNPNWNPIEFIENNEYQGISIDTLKIIQEKLNIKYNFIITSSWKESQQLLKEKKCDILPTFVKTKEREDYANFTEPYLNYSLAIITKNGKRLVTNIDTIINKTMSRKAGSGIISILKNKYPDLKVIESPTYMESFKDVIDGKAYFTIATLPMLSYYKNNYDFDELQIVGFLKMKYNLSIAVRSDDKILLSILNKKLKEISNKTHNIIFDKWVNKKNKKEFDYSLFRKILIIILVMVIFLLYYQILLKRKVKERTLELEEKNNSLKIEISKREATEKKLIKAKEIAEESSNSKTKFLASISHELKTPMNGILSYSSIGMKRIDSMNKEKLLKYFSNINISGNRLLNLLDDLLNIAKLESNNVVYDMVLNDLVKLIKESMAELSIIAEEKNIKILFEEVDEIKIIFDFKRFAQVILNVLSNAIKFSPDGSNIFIELRKEDDFVTILIKDEGPGIDKKDLNTIFNSFTQGDRTKENSIKGAGLGLAISQRITEAHNGKIWALNNKSGKGAVFLIRLPRKV